MKTKLFLAFMAFGASFLILLGLLFVAVEVGFGAR